MPRPLYATRYLRPGNEGLASFIVDELDTLDYPSTIDFYNDLIDRNPAREDYALLGANDRFFLATHILGRHDANHPWLWERCREVEESPDGHIDLWARYHFKSSLITQAGAVQEIIRNPEITICLFSMDKALAVKQLLPIKAALESNQTVKTLYPDVFYLDPSKQSPWWRSDALVVKRDGTRKEATIEAHGLVTKMPTGSHYDLLIYDDMLDQHHVTETMVKKVLTAWELSDNLGSASGTRKWVIGTRYSFGDCYGTLIERGVLTPRLYPATHNGKKEGKPVFLTQKRLEEVKREQPGTFSAQMLQNPIAGHEATFEMKWLRPWLIRPSILNVYIMGDPSSGKKRKTNDRTAIAVVGVDVNGNKYLLDGVRHRMRLAERLKWLMALHRKWRNEPGVQLVNVGWERYGMDTDLNHFEDQMALLDNPDDAFAIEELATPRETPESKHDRILRLQPDFENGSFFLPGLVRYDQMKLDLEQDITVVKEGGEREQKALQAYMMARMEHYWKVDGEKSTMEYSRKRDETRRMKEMRATGDAFRIVTPIVRKDEDGRIYDLTRDFVEEYRFHPFAAHDDLIDAVSRIYDMNPSAPILFEEKAVDERYYLDS